MIGEIWFEINGKWEPGYQSIKQHSKNDRRISDRRKNDRRKTTDRRQITRRSL